VCPLIVLAALFYYAVWLNTTYSANLSRVTNGVGMEPDKEGQSNLGFHSAISPTKQPAALLRLEGDYKDNPWSPMLYLREGVLSAFSGKEIVSASLIYDTDVPRIGVGQVYLAPQVNSSQLDREPVVQSIYLLTKHNAPFAIDF